MRKLLADAQQDACLQTDHRQYEDRRGKNGAVNQDDLGKQPDAGHADEQHGKLSEHHRGKDLIDDVDVLLVQHRPRLQPLDDEGPEQDGGDRITRHAE